MKTDDASGQHIHSILIVDDIPANLKLLGNVLKCAGYKVRPVTSGKLALQVAEREKPDLILLDVMMPGMDGYEVCRQLKENPDLRDIPVIYISALNDTKDIVKAFTSGGVDYITKPFQAEEVIARVSTHLQIQQQRKDLQILNATKDKFFSIISHDLRSPFTSFLGLTSLMKDDLKTMSSTEIEEMAGWLNKSASNIFGLLENLLEWSLMQRGITSFNPESFLLSDKISGCMELSKDAALKKEIQCFINIPVDMEVYADAHMFETVIRNLVTNAVKFTPKGGRITLSSRMAENNTILVSIQDTGTGIHKDLIGKLFQLDEQTGRKGTDGEPSTGLGLIICKDFVEKNGGTIRVESEEGKGSIFSFTLLQAPGNTNSGTA